jgi:hypothetical protein
MRLSRWTVVLVLCATLFYGITGYLFTVPLIGENSRWRGINRGPESLGLTGDVVSLRSTDGISLKGGGCRQDLPGRTSLSRTASITLAR